MSIALQVDGVLEAGCVFDAVAGVPYTATRGGGAYRDGEPICVCDACPGPVLACHWLPIRSTHSDRSPPPYVREFLISSQGLRRAGAAAMDFVAIAAGRVDGYREFGLNPWDVAAGILLVQEAGGQVTDMEGDR